MSHTITCSGKCNIYRCVLNTCTQLVLAMKAHTTLTALATVLAWLSLAVSIKRFMSWTERQLYYVWYYSFSL